MRIFVNSQEREVPGGATVQQLVELSDLTQKRVAIEVNAELVVKAAWTSHVLQPDDRVEIVSFVGGG